MLKINIICNEETELMLRDKIHHNLSYNDKGEFDCIFITELNNLDDIKKYNHKCSQLYVGCDEQLLKNKNYNNVIFLTSPIQSLMINSIIETSIEKSKYDQIPISILCEASHEIKVPCFLYIRLEKRLESNTQYIKISNEDENIEIERWNKYKDKGVEYVYIDKEKYMPFIQALCKTNPDLSVLLLQDQFLKYGFNKSVLEKVDFITEDIIKSVKNSAISFLIKKFYIKRSSSYSYQHSYLTSLIFSYLCFQAGLDDKQIKKGVISACIHDIALESEELIYLHDISPDSIKTASTNDKNLISNHTSRLLELVENCEEIDLDMIDIIKNHHVHSVNGYPHESIDKLRILSKIFNLSHELVVQLYKSSFKEDKFPYILKVLRTDFNQDPYSLKLIQKLESIKL